MAEIVLHTWPGFALPGRPPCPTSTPFGLKVRRVLAWKGLPFRQRIVAWEEAADVLPGLSDTRKLPVLEIDGEPVEDSTRIAWRLEVMFPDPPLVPASPVGRGRMELLEQWADEVLYRYRQYAELHFTPDEKLVAAYYPDRDPEAAARLLEARRKGMEFQLYHQGLGRIPRDAFEAEFARSLDGLAALAEEQDFLVGAEPCLADLAVFAHFERVLCGADPWYEERLRERPALMAWIEAVDRRSAVGADRMASRGAA